MRGPLERLHNRLTRWVSVTESDGEGTRAGAETDDGGRGGGRTTRWSRIARAVPVGVVRRSHLAKFAVALLVGALLVPVARAIGLQITSMETGFLMVGSVFIGLLAIGVALRRDTLRSLNELRRKANALAAGELDHEFESEREDEIGELFRAFDRMQDTLEERIEEAETERVAAQEAQAAAEAERERAEAAAAETERFASRLEARAAEFSDVMADCARGDLTCRLNAETDDEAMQEVAVAFNETITEIEQTIADIVEFAGEVATASKRVREQTMDVSGTGQEVSASVDQISEGASKQNDRLQSVSSDVDKMSATIEEVAASADEVAQRSREAATAGSTGLDAADEAVIELHDIREQTEETAAIVAALDEQMDRIGDIVDVITRIADQTNILALNARIEAARAGEAGDGFAVVAKEVKQLAEETQESASEIESLIETVQDQTSESVAEMTHIEDRVRDGVETVEETQVALDSVVDRVKDTDVGVQEISRAMDEQASSVGDIAATIDELASISEEMTAEASTVVDAAEEQAATLAGVSDETMALSEKAEGLETTLDSFQTSTTDDSPDTRAQNTIEGDVEASMRGRQPSVDSDPVDDLARVRTGGSTSDVEPVCAETDDAKPDGVETDNAESNDSKPNGTRPYGAKADDTESNGDDVFEWVDSS